MNLAEKSIPITSSNILVNSKEVLPTAHPRSMTLNFSMTPDYLSSNNPLVLMTSSQTMAHVIGNLGTKFPLSLRFFPQ